MLFPLEKAKCGVTKPCFKRRAIFPDGIESLYMVNRIDLVSDQMCNRQLAVSKEVKPPFPALSCDVTVICVIAADVKIGLINFRLPGRKRKLALHLYAGGNRLRFVASRRSTGLCKN